MSECPVLIAGGGPTGMMLAAELALGGVNAAIVERRASQEVIGTRGSGLHSRTMEVFDQRGIADRFLAEGKPHPAVHFHIPLDVSDFPTRHNYALGLWQNHVERIMAGWLGELKVPIYRQREVADFTQDDSGVNVALSDGSSLRAQYLVGCDGGRSLVRKKAGIDFSGWDATMSWLIAEAQMAVEPKWGFHEDAVGIHAIGKGDGGVTRLVLTEPEVGAKNEPTLQDIKHALTTVYGTDFGIHNPTWISRFTDMTRQAASYRDRRVLLAGDAAHIHPPLGGQGLNLGVQDAVNLGWKLAQVVKGISPQNLLDTYHAERHPVAARVLRTSMAHVAIRRTDERTKALGEIYSELLRMDEPRKRLAAEMCGLAVRYDFGEGHPLLGRRVPDLDLNTANGPMHLFTLLHEARPLLLNLGEPGRFDITQWGDRIKSIDARYEGQWELPAIGYVAAPTAILIRPDGYVAWVEDQTQTPLDEVLARWLGPQRCQT